MPTPTGIELTLRHVPHDVFARIERTAAAHGQTVEEFVIDQADQATRSADEPFDTQGWLERTRKLRAEIAKNGPFLRPGETVKDLAREGLRDA